MKKFKKLIALCSLAFVMAGTTACSVLNGIFNKHDFAAEWTYDETAHWKACEDESCQEVDEKADHTYGEGIVTTPATEEAEGVMTYECTVCGYEKTEAIEKLEPAHTHTWASEWSTDETYHWYASTCGHDDKDKTEHDYDDGFVEKPATDKEEGVMIYTCIDCGYDYEEAIPTLNHKHQYSDAWSKDETSHWHATTCGHNNIRDKENHTYGDGVVTRDPTEDLEGITEYTCTVCEYVKEEPIAKLPHTHRYDETKWAYDENYHFYASACGHEDEMKSKAVHKWGEDVILQQPTEDAEGIKTNECTVCGYVKTSSIAKLPHEHKFATEWSKDADYHWYDSLCGHDEAVTKIPHDWDDGKITQEPTATEDGVKTYTCECDQTKTESVPSLSHTHTFATEWSKDADYHWYAVLCEHTSEEVKIAHDFNEFGTCVECNYHKVCENCGKCVTEACPDCAEKCYSYNLTITGATVKDKITACETLATTKAVVLDKNKTFLGYMTADKKYYDATTAVTGDLSLIALYQEDMLAYAPSDTPQPGASFTFDGISAVHDVKDNVYVTTVTFAAGTAGSKDAVVNADGTLAAPFFAGRGTQDSGSHVMNIYSPANGENLMFVYIYNYESTDVAITYMAENYGNQGDVTVTLKPGLNVFPYNFGGQQGTNGSFWSCDHRIYLVEEATEEIKLDVYGYIYVADMEPELVISSMPDKIIYEDGEEFDPTGLSVVLTLAPFSRNFVINDYELTVEGDTVTVSAMGVSTSFMLNFSNKNEIIHYAPNTYLGVPEGPDGKAPGSAGAYEMSDKISAYYVTLEDGTNATEFKIGKGALANTGVSIWNNQNVSSSGLDGYNCGVPQYANVEKEMLLHVTNNGTTPISFRYGAIDYYYDKGYVDITLAGGESKDVVVTFLHTSNSVGLNHQLLILKDVEADTSVTIWGEFMAENLTSIAIAKPATQLNYEVGETFSAEGLVLSATGSATGSTTNYYSRVYISTNYVTNFDGVTFTEEHCGINIPVNVTFAGRTCTYYINVVSELDCENGVHYNVEKLDEELYAGMEGSDAMYYYACLICGEATEETYAADKIAFVPHHNIGGGHTIEYVTLEDGRIAAKLTFNSDVSAGVTYTITANSYPTNSNVAFPVRNPRRVYMEMTSSADVNITWQPEFYGDRDPLTFELKANETQGASRIIQYTGSTTYSNLPYQEIVCNSAIPAGTVVYMTGYFYTVGEVSEISVNTPATKATFQVGETFSSAGLTLKPTSNESLYGDVVIYNVTTNLDGRVFTAEDVGKKLVTVTWGDLTYTYEITVEGEPPADHEHELVSVAAKSATCTETGNVAYWTCEGCAKLFTDENGENETTLEKVTLEMVEHETKVFYDDEGHWEECQNCDYASEKVAHEPNVEGLCECGYQELCKDKCEVCGECVDADCVECEEKCLFLDMNKVITFAPNVALGKPEGPDGKAPGSDGAYIYDESITAEYVVLENGAYATQIALPNGAAAHSGVSFGNNKNAESVGQAGYNCAIPQYAEVVKPIRMYFTNNGASEITFKYSAIDYYYDKGAVEVTLAAGESKTVILYTTFSNDTIGLNHQIVFLKDAAAGSSLTVWGEFVAENITGISVSVAADKLNFALGETFSAEGLILKARGVASAVGTNYSDTYQRVYVSQNYTTDLDGYVFTAEDVAAGKKTVTVKFAGLTTTYEVVVYEHAHEIEFVDEVEAVKCEQDGVAAHYACTVVGCGMLFNDAMGNEVLEAPAVVYCHEGVALPGKQATCVDCGKAFGENGETENWVLFRPEKDVFSGSITGFASEYADVDGVYGVKFTFGAGATADQQVTLEFNNNDGMQTTIPNAKSDSTVRKVIMYYHNYGTEAITLQFENDNDGAHDLVTIPAGGVVVSSYVNTRTGGGRNYYYLKLKNALTTEVTVGVYGYMYIGEGEFTGLVVASETTHKNTFKVGETFTTEGLVLYTSGGINGTLVASGYTTDFDGYVFTEEDLGTKVITVKFAGLTVTYNIEVAAHNHVLELVKAEDPIVCEKDGYEAYYACTVDGCKEIFADANGTVKLDAPVAISCHTEPTAATLPGTALVCVSCGKSYAIKSMENWVYLNLTTQTNSIGSNIKNGKVEQAEVEGMPGTKFYVGAGTVGATNDSAFYLKMSDNDAGRQTVIPNLGSGAPSGELRTVILFYKNYSNEAITMNLQNDAQGGNGKVTVPANGTAICQFTIKNAGGSNWFYFYVDCNPTIDIEFGVYGYFYVHDGEVGSTTINKEATKKTFTVGETFSAEGLVLNAVVPSATTKTLYVQTGYTTDLDGYVFTAEDIGTHTVTVTFAGVTTTYEITVTAE